jgi:Major capsid protein GP7
MSTLGVSALTLADWAKRLDPSGKVSAIVELLGQTNEILTDMRFVEGNLPTGHRTTVRTGLPTVYWRLLNQGVTPSKSTTAQVDEQAGMLEAWSEVDKDLALLNGNAGAFRLSEGKAFLEAMNQEMAQTVFYGNSGLAPEEFTGLAARYSSTTAGNGQNIVSGGGSGSDNSSIWLIVWGENTVHGLFPKGSQAGLIHEDRGEQIIQDSSGRRMVALMDRYQWKAGLAVRDWRYAVRIPNVDISDLVASTGTQLSTATTRLFNLLSKAVHRIPNMGVGTPAFYMNRTVMEYLDIQARQDVSTGGGLTYENVGGKRVASFRGIPIRTCDALLETEATVS